jgi:hypothetical protein
MEEKNTNVKQRVLQFAKTQNVALEKFFENLGVTYAVFKGKSLKTSLASDTLVKLFTNYPMLNKDWILFNRGEMILPSEGKSDYPIVNTKVQNVFHIANSLMK